MGATAQHYGVHDESSRGGETFTVGLIVLEEGLSSNLFEDIY